jgi:hypothetical protein
MSCGACYQDAGGGVCYTFGEETGKVGSDNLWMVIISVRQSCVVEQTDEIGNINIILNLLGL